jgi:hypothetical protein
VVPSLKVAVLAASDRQFDREKAGNLASEPSAVAKSPFPDRLEDPPDLV